MADTLQFINIDPDKFTDDIVSRLSKIIHIPKQEEELLTQEEVAKLLKVTPQTIINYQNKGSIKAYVIEGLVRYKKSEIINNLKVLEPKNGIDTKR